MIENKFTFYELSRFLMPILGLMEISEVINGFEKVLHTKIDHIDKLYDYFNDLMESKKKKTIYIPLLSGLFLISPADTQEITLAAGGSSKKKKHPFTTIYELLRKPGKGKFGFDVSFYCHIDLMRAALATVDNNNAISWVQTFFADLLDASVKDVKDKILDVSKPVLQSKDEETFINERSVQAYICNVLEFDPNIRGILVKFFENNYK